MPQSSNSGRAYSDRLESRFIRRLLVRDLDNVFFQDSQFRQVWGKPGQSIELLPYRLLSSMGVRSGTVDCIRAKIENKALGDVHALAQLILEDWKYSCPPNASLWRGLVEGAEGNTATPLKFLSFMHEKIVKKEDPGVVNLYTEAAQALPGDSDLTFKLKRSVHTCYMCGIPDFHDALAVVPWFDPKEAQHGFQPPPATPREPSVDEFLALLDTDAELQQILATAMRLPQYLRGKSEQERVQELHKRLRKITKAIYGIDIWSLLRDLLGAHDASWSGSSLVPSVLPDDAPWLGDTVGGLTLWGGIGPVLKVAKILALVGLRLLRQHPLGRDRGRFFRYGEYHIKHLNPGYGRRGRRRV